VQTGDPARVHHDSVSPADAAARSGRVRFSQAGITFPSGPVGPHLWSIFHDRKRNLIARLKELGVKLDREVNVTGTIQELTLRISELEEELDGDGGRNGSDQAGPAVISTSVQPGADITSGSITENPASTEIVELVAVETLATLHIDALHATRNEPVSIVEPGVIIRVSEQDADELIDKGLAREV
jgi:hypothetical protein